MVAVREHVEESDMFSGRRAHRAGLTPSTGNTTVGGKGELRPPGRYSSLGRPTVEGTWSRMLARIGGVAAITAVVAYLTWRIAFTLPLGGGWSLAVAWGLVAFEALPLTGLVHKVVTLWSIDSLVPEPVTEPRAGMRVAVLIPTNNEPVEVLAPTVAAACAVEPAHETWVLDDGDRDWVRASPRSSPSWFRRPSCSAARRPPPLDHWRSPLRLPRCSRQGCGA